LSRRAAAVPAALVAFVFLVFAPALLTSRAFYARDIYSFWHPGVEAFVRAVSEGAWPLWNPAFAFGGPMAANPSFQVAYPPTWLNLVLPAGLYFKLYVFAHTLAGALGVAALARRLRAGRLGAIAAGAAWAASGPLLSSIGMYHHFAGAAWMPWVLVALDGVLRRPTAARAVALGATAAGQSLAGSADLCFMTVLAALGWAAPVLWRRRPDARLALAVGGALALAALLGAVQWLPVVDLLPGTQRGAPDASTSLYWSLHPLSLLDAWLPRLTTGASASGTLGAAARARLFEGREPLLASAYLGLPAALAAACALLPRPRRGRALLLVAGCALFAVAALGRFTPLLPAAMHLPGVALFRFPPKYLLPAVLMWALLVGLGVAAVARGGEAVRRAAIVGALCAAAAVALLALALQGDLPRALARRLADPQPPDALMATVVTRLLVAAAWLMAGAVLLILAGRGLVAPRAAALALAAAVAGDLAWQARDVNPLLPDALVRYRPDMVDFALDGVTPARVYSRPYPAEKLRQEFVRVPAGFSPGAGWILGFVDRLSPAIGARWGLLGSYDGDLTGLSPYVLGRLSYRLQELHYSPVGARLLQRAGVDYVVSLEREAFGGVLAPVWEHESVFTHPVHLLRLPDPLPKAYVAQRARVVGGEEEVVQALEDPGYDPRSEVLLSGVPEGALLRVEPSAVFEAAVRPLHRRSDALSFEVRSSAPGYLVVLEAFDRGWQARVDASPARVLQANALFRAVQVPAGVHRVELRYRPRLLPWGALATLAGVLAAGLVLVRAARVR
jgi:hypothetical protein